MSAVERDYRLHAVGLVGARQELTLPIRMPSTVTKSVEY
jgi:hypothetical protein